MNTIKPNFPNEIIHAIIVAEDLFPNNALIPFLRYKKVFDLKNISPEDIQKLLQHNPWRNS